MSDRTRGFLIGGAAVFLITPDALLCRLAGANESVAVVTFWRSAFICALCCVITSVGNRGVRRLLRLTRDHCRPLLFIGAISSVTSLGFPLSFLMTGSAEALLIISLNPLWAGVIGWWFLGDVLPLRTRLALAGATASIMLIFVPRVLGVDGRTSREQQPNRLAGDALAFVTGLSLASAMNAMRYYRRKHTQLPAQVVQIIASGTVTLVTAPFCSPSIIPREPGSLLPTAVAMAACISIAYLGFNIAPKYITAADFGILTLVETVPKTCLNLLRFPSGRSMQVLTTAPPSPHRYASSLKTVGLCLVYAPLWPWAYLLTTIALLFNYGCTKVGVAYWYKKPPMVSEVLCPSSISEGMLIASLSAC